MNFVALGITSFIDLRNFPRDSETPGKRKLRKTDNIFFKYIYIYFRQTRDPNNDHAQRMPEIFLLKSSFHIAACVPDVDEVTMPGATVLISTKSIQVC